MKEDTARGIQVAANVAVIIAAVLLSVVLAKNYLIRKPEPSVAFVAGANNISTRANRPAADSQIQPGTKISLEGIDWAKNGKTLVLALSDKCHFCSESAPFYQRLSKDHGNTRLVAVLPQPIEDGKKYLNHLNVSVDDVKQAPLTAVGVEGTPTLILVDSNGVAVKSWVGKLASTRETEVLASFR